MKNKFLKNIFLIFFISLSFNLNFSKAQVPLNDLIPEVDDISREVKIKIGQFILGEVVITSDSKINNRDIGIYKEKAYESAGDIYLKSECSFNLSFEKIKDSKTSRLLSGQIDCQKLKEYLRDYPNDFIKDTINTNKNELPLKIDTLKKGAGGSTKFKFGEESPFDFNMSVQGSPQDVIDSVIPHEVTHIILSKAINRGVSRLLDEGCCGTNESFSEMKKQIDLFKYNYITNNYIDRMTDKTLERYLNVKEYPSDINKTLDLYSTGYMFSLFLITRPQVYLSENNSQVESGYQKLIEFEKIFFNSKNLALSYRKVFDRDFDINEFKKFSKEVINANPEKLNIMIAKASKCKVRKSSSQNGIQLVSGTEDKKENNNEKDLDTRRKEISKRLNEIFK